MIIQECLNSCVYPIFTDGQRMLLTVAAILIFGLSYAALSSGYFNSPKKTASADKYDSFDETYEKDVLKHMSTRTDSTMSSSGSIELVSFEASMAPASINQALSTTSISYSEPRKVKYNFVPNEVLSSLSTNEAIDVFYSKAEMVEVFNCCNSDQSVVDSLWSDFAGSDGLIHHSKLVEAFRQLRLGNYQKISLLQFQQPINCCNITSLAYAFSLVTEKEVTVNDIFHIARLPGWYVTHDGMTLAETFTAAVDVAAHIGGLFVEAYHFDEENVDYEGFKAAVVEDGIDNSDIMILNFSVRIAHQYPTGGGHFSLLGYSDIEPNGQDLILTICDVHPLKYGKTWVCSARHMFEAMVDKDGDVKRARGVIRVARNECTRILPGLHKAKKAVCYCDEAEVQREWLARFCRFPPEVFQDVLNMGGMDALALSLSALNGTIICPDEIMRRLNLNYIDVLSKVAAPVDIEKIANDYFLEMKWSNYTAYTQELGETSENFLQFLKNTIGPNRECATGLEDVIAMVSFCVNCALGTKLVNVDPKSEAAKLSHFTYRWGALIRVDTERRVVAIADPASKSNTRLWETAIDDVWAAFAAVGVTSTVIVSKQLRL